MVRKSRFRWSRCTAVNSLLSAPARAFRWMVSLSRAPVPSTNPPSPVRAFRWTRQSATMFQLPRSTSPVFSGVKPHVWEKILRFPRSFAWSAMPLPPRLPLPRSQTRFPVCLYRLSLPLLLSQLWYGCWRDRPLAMLWHGAFLCWSSVAPVHWDLLHRLPLWWETVSEPNTESCSKPRFLWKKPARFRS